jgi:hypothetical protein
MNAFSSLFLLLAFGMANSVVGRDVFCLTETECKQRQKVLGLKTFKSGRYGDMGYGCFSKHSTLYWSVAGTYKQQSTMDLGTTVKKRVMCVEEEISTKEPTNEPTAAETPAAFDDNTIDENEDGTGTTPETTARDPTDNDTKTSQITATKNEVAIHSTPTESNDTVDHDTTSQEREADETAQYLLDSVDTNFPSHETEVVEDIAEEASEGETAQHSLDSEEMNYPAQHSLDSEVTNFPSHETEVVEDIAEEASEGETAQHSLDSEGTNYPLHETEVVEDNAEEASEGETAQHSLDSVDTNYPSHETEVVEDIAEEASEGETAQHSLDSEDTNYPSHETEVVVEDIAEETSEGVVVEAYLTKTEQIDVSARLLQIGVAVFAVGLLLVAAFIHRSRERKRQRTNSVKRQSKPDSIEIERGSLDDLPQNTIEVFDAKSEDIDDVGCWTPANFNQKSQSSATSFGENSTVGLWRSLGITSSYTSSYREEESESAATSLEDSSSVNLWRSLGITSSYTSTYKEGESQSAASSGDSSSFSLWRSLGITSTNNDEESNETSQMTNT